VRAAATWAAWSGPAREAPRVIRRRHCQRRRLGRPRLGANGPPDDADQVQDRQLEDEHQEDDLDHAAILGALSRSCRYGAIVTWAVCGALVTTPSLTVKVKLSAPVAPVFGT